MVYSAVLVDDEQAAHHAMKNLLKNHPNIAISGQAYNGKQAIEIINNLKPDLVFLDIQMPGMNGFELLRHLTCRPYIVCCTAYDQYAVKAFNENAVDYLLKPVDDGRFARCIDKIERLIPLHQHTDISRLLALGELFSQPQKASAIPVQIRSKTIFVPCNKITYCVARDGYVSLLTDDGKEQVCNFTLKQLEDRLPDDFIRVQKSYIINKTKIEEVHKYFNNRLILVMNDLPHTRITTGTSYINSIRAALML